LKRFPPGNLSWYIILEIINPRLKGGILMITVGKVTVDPQFDYKRDIDPFAEYKLLKQAAEYLMNFRDDKIITNFYQFDEREVTVDGQVLKVPDKGLYMRYEPWVDNKIVFRLLKITGLSKCYEDPESAWTETREYGAWFAKKGEEPSDLHRVFDAVINALRYEKNHH
jgi:hypothetical protein